MYQRTPGQWIAYWMILIFLLGPAVPLFRAWNRLRKSEGGMSGVNGSTVTVLIVQCASFLHIVIGIIYPHALGRGYSNVRYALIYTWIAVCAATVLMNGVRPQVKALVNIVGTLLLLDWFFILITSSVA